MKCVQFHFTRDYLQTVQSELLIKNPGYIYDFGLVSLRIVSPVLVWVLHKTASSLHRCHMQQGE